MRRLIQVGVGERGRLWSDIVAGSEIWEAAAYVDIDHAHLAAAATRHGMPLHRCFSSLTHALASVEADAVLDATPPDQRRAVCMAALKRGLPVLCEAPLTDSPRGARQLSKLARERGALLMVAHDLRHHPIMHGLRRELARERTGAPAHAELRCFRRPRTPAPGAAAPPLLLELGLHHLDLIRMVFDSDIHAVQCRAIDPAWSEASGEAAVMAHLELVNGIAVSYHASHATRGMETEEHGDWRIEGDRGALFAEGGALYFADRPGSRRKLAAPRVVRPRQAGMLDAFAHALDTGEEPETSAARSLNAHAAAHALLRAARTGRRATVDGRSA